MTAKANFPGLPDPLCPQHIYRWAALNIDILRDSNFRDSHIEIFGADIFNELAELHWTMDYIRQQRVTVEPAAITEIRYRGQDWVNKNNPITVPIAQRTETPNRATSIPSLFLTNCASLNQTKLNEVDLIIDTVKPNIISLTGLWRQRAQS